MYRRDCYWCIQGRESSCYQRCWN